MEEVTLSTNCPEGGKIHLNTMDLDLDGGEWAGKYFVEFALTLTAIPEEGYEFVGWSGSVVSEEDTVELDLKEGGAEVYATFREIKE